MRYRWRKPISTARLGSLDVGKWRLDNGLEVILIPDPSATSVSYMTWFRVGSRHERAGPDHEASRYRAYGEERDGDRGRDEAHDRHPRTVEERPRMARLVKEE